MLIGVKLVYVQLINRHHYLEAAGGDGTDTQMPVPGRIYARGLEPMAVSVAKQSICANPVQIAHSKEMSAGQIAREVARSVGLDATDLRKKLERGIEKKLRFVYLARLLDPKVVESLPTSRLPSVWTTREYTRVYPGGKLACHVLGRRSDFHEPLDGVELRWSFVMEGRPGTRLTHVDRYGRSILGADSSGALPPEPGRHIVLTIDWSLQEVVELAVDRMMKVNQPRAATCVVMDPNDGSILALASRPAFNPSGLQPGSREEINRRLKNLPVTRQYEPGSLFKVLLAAATLESPEYDDERYYCDGMTEIGGEPLRCWEPKGHGSCDLTEMIAQSCNIAAAKFALLIGPEHYHHFLSTLGLGGRTGIGLPGEANGSLRPIEEMAVRDLANLGFGQGVAVTDIQMLNAICAVTNGGSLMQPHVIRAVVDARTNTIAREVEPVQIQQVCSRETSERVRSMMGAVVDHGTGALAKIEGLEVGGKTGTAQKWIEEAGGFVEGRNIVSFIMIAPLENPRFAILVTADEPQVGEHGAAVAAPVARTVALAALRQAGLLPEQVEINEDIGV